MIGQNNINTISSKLKEAIHHTAPTSEYRDEEIEEFYELVEETITSTYKKDFIVILGD